MAISYKRTLKKQNSRKKIFFSEKLSDEWESTPLFSSLSDNPAAITRMFVNCSDIVYRSFNISNEKDPALLIFIKNIADEEKISNFIIKPLTEIDVVGSKELCARMFFEKLVHKDIKSSEVQEVKSFGEAVNAILLVC